MSLGMYVRFFVFGCWALLLKEWFWILFLDCQSLFMGDIFGDSDYCYLSFWQSSAGILHWTAITSLFTWGNDNVVPYRISCINREAVDCSFFLETDTTTGGVSFNDRSALSYRDTFFWRGSVPSSSPTFCSPRRLFLGSRDDQYFFYKKPHSSCEIEDCIETHLCELCVVLRLRVLRVVVSSLRI